VAAADTPAARSQLVLDQAVAADLPGCSAAVGERGVVIWQGVRGMADLETRTPISPDTIFDVASVSKQFTATAALLLADRGELALSDPLSKHLTGLPSWSRTVTLDQLMHQVSGIPDFMDMLGVLPEEETGRERGLQVISEVEFLASKPGSRWKYSNSNYLLLGLVVEQVSGQPLAEFLRENIFGPLQLPMVMGSTSPLPGKAHSYRISSYGDWEIADWHVDVTGAGGIQTTPEALVRWADNYRTGRVGGKELLKEQLAGAELMDPADTTVSGPGGSRYGAGIVSDPDGTLWHDGDYGGFHSEFFVLPDRQRAIAVACNSSGTNIAALRESLTEIWQTT